MAKNNKNQNSSGKLNLAVHETLELHEVLTVKQASYLKANMMEGLVQDKELIDIIRKDAMNSKKAIKEIQELLP